MAIVPSFIPFGDSINNAVNGFFGTDAIDVIRSVNWDTKYLWALKFDNGFLPPPFDSFFPAQDVTIPMAIVETETITFAQSDIQIPLRSKSKEISITFYDDDKRTILYWLQDWMEIDIFNDGQFVSGLKDIHPIVAKRRVELPDNFKSTIVHPVRDVVLTQLSRYKKVAKTVTYSIFPIGQLDFNGSQASEAQTYTMQFMITEIKESIGGADLSFGDVAKDILGRFL